MSQRFRSLRRLRHSPFFLAALVLVLASGSVVGGTFASFAAETQNGTPTGTNPGPSILAAGWIGAPSALSFTPSGYDASLAWTAGSNPHSNFDGQSLESLDNGSSSSCPASITSGYTATAMASASTASYTQSNANGFTTLSAALTAAATSLTVTSGASFPAAPFTIQIDEEQLTVSSVGTGTNWTVARGANGTTAAAHLSAAGVVRITDPAHSADPYGGHYECYQMVSTRSATPNWNASTSISAKQIGLVATSIAINNTPTGSFAKNDTIVVTFNQKPAALLAMTNVKFCAVWPAGTAPVAVTIFLEYGACATTNAEYQVKITGLTHGTTGSVTAGSTTAAFTGAPAIAASSPWTVTWTLNATTTANAINTGTATAIPDLSSVKSNAATDQAPACVSALYNCQPSVATTL